MSLYLHAFPLDVARATRLAARERLLPPGDDLGYAIHALFAATFAEKAPRPWAYLPPGRGGGPGGRLLAYATHSIDELRLQAAKFANPAFAAPLGVEAAESKPMPTFAVGDRLGVHVRLRPIARRGSDRVGHVPSTARTALVGRERDIYLSAVDAAVARGVEPEDRASCYARWALPRLAEAGLAVETLAVDGHRLTRLMARDRRNTTSVTRTPNGPDVDIVATVTVRDPSVFSASLATGIGRFRSFGFGMLLLSPSRR